jgi:molybdopterin-guanine dinucleotide biosynthesis protein A
MDKQADISAIILAGGQSSRMKQDKALLPVNGKSLIESVASQLEPFFADIIISARDGQSLDFLPYRIAVDRSSGQGPLMGILTGLEASRTPYNFVIACDIPQINIGFLESMLEHVRRHDVVVPVSGDSKYEPLFAFYRKDLIPHIQTLLAKGIRQIIKLYPLAKSVKHVPMPAADWYFNLNTLDDFDNYCMISRGSSSLSSS